MTTAVAMVNVALERMIAADPTGTNILYWSTGPEHEGLSLTPFGFRCLLDGLARQWGVGWTRLTERDFVAAARVRR